MKHAARNLLLMIPAMLVFAVTMPARAQLVTSAVTAPGVAYRTFESQAAKHTVSFHIWLPPEYEAQPVRTFPLLIWLHGAGDGTLGIPWLSSYFATAMATFKNLS